MVRMIRTRGARHSALVSLRGSTGCRASSAASCSRSSRARMEPYTSTFATSCTGLSAGILIAVIPILIVYAVLQRWIIGGLAGALKG
jgi:hypothetical protein